MNERSVSAARAVPWASVWGCAVAVCVFTCTPFGVCASSFIRSSRWSYFPFSWKGWCIHVDQDFIVQLNARVGMSRLSRAYCTNNSYGCVKDTGEAVSCKRATEMLWWWWWWLWWWWWWWWWWLQFDQANINAAELCKRGKQIKLTWLYCKIFWINVFRYVLVTKVAIFRVNAWYDKNNKGSYI